MSIGRCVNVNAGPRAAISRILDQLEANPNAAWAEQARLEALCGASQRTLREVATALRCWAAFTTTVPGVHASDLLPPTVDGLVAFSRAFHVKETYRNYVGKIRLACEIPRLPTDSMDHRSIARAKSTNQAFAAAPAEKFRTRWGAVAALVRLTRVKMTYCPHGFTSYRMRVCCGCRLKLLASCSVSMGSCTMESFRAASTRGST